ncbi:hypothetical protein FV228_00140 [Methylobacterium sp. WL18]|nr:hypothetical protein FV228_00140 [Methylobacterium sp. WL18]
MNRTDRPTRDSGEQHFGRGADDDRVSTTARTRSDFLDTASPKPFERRFSVPVFEATITAMIFEKAVVSAVVEKFISVTVPTTT